MSIGSSPSIPVLRRTRILQLLDLRLALSNKQIAASVLSSTNYGHWKARTETKILFDAGLVKRSKIMGSNDLVYYTGKKPDDLDHLIMVNWVWVRLYRMGYLEFFENEKELQGLTPDAYFVFKGKPYFLEVNRSARHDFEKVPLYTEYFNSVSWCTPEWPGGKQFAVILVITDTEENKRYIQSRIEKENTVGLRFSVATLNEFWEKPEVFLKWETTESI